MVEWRGDDPAQFVGLHPDTCQLFLIKLLHSNTPASKSIEGFLSSGRGTTMCDPTHLHRVVRDACGPWMLMPDLIALHTALWGMNTNTSTHMNTRSGGGLSAAVRRASTEAATLALGADALVAEEVHAASKIQKVYRTKREREKTTKQEEEKKKRRGTAQQYGGGPPAVRKVMRGWKCVCVCVSVCVCVCVCVCMCMDVPAKSGVDSSMW